jgi:hypothetical protein
MTPSWGDAKGECKCIACGAVYTVPFFVPKILILREKSSDEDILTFRYGSRLISGATFSGR